MTTPAPPLDAEIAESLDEIGIALKDDLIVEYLNALHEAARRLRAPPATVVGVKAKSFGDLVLFASAVLDGPHGLDEHKLANGVIAQATHIAQLEAGVARSLAPAAGDEEMARETLRKLVRYHEPAGHEFVDAHVDFTADVETLLAFAARVRQRELDRCCDYLERTGLGQTAAALRGGIAP